MSAVSGTRAGSRWGPALYALGATTCVAGFLLHLPMFFAARSEHYRLAGMPMDGAMIAGMALLVAGLVVALVGLVLGTAPRGQVVTTTFVALDRSRLTRRHAIILVTVAVAVVIDLTKTTTLAFAMPGMAVEYGLKSPANPTGEVPVSLLALAGLTGTVLGSLLWGWLADVLGRRAAIMLASVVFVSTAACGAMPSFGWNLVMCLAMGAGAGGMLPIAYSLLTEIVPARHRGWLVILIGGNTAGAYALTSWLAGELTPTFGWRALWLIGAPTGLLLVVLSRFVPESPRFLMATGRPEEAARVMQRLGVEAGGDQPQPATHARRSTLLTAVCALALAAGVLQFGFQLWMPANLQQLGFSPRDTDFMLRDAALLGAPVTLAVALAYGLWNAKLTMILLSVATAVAVSAFALLPDDLVLDRGVAVPLLMLPLAGISALGAAVIAYAAELAHTGHRGRVTGLVAGATKFGGLAVVGWSTLGMAAPTITATAVVGVVPLVVALVAFARVVALDPRDVPLDGALQPELDPVPVP